MSNNFAFLAQPWWVNLLVLVPFAAFFLLKKKGLFLASKTLVLVGVFGVAFGLVEAAVVVYLRAAFGFLSGTLFPAKEVLNAFPTVLLPIEAFREAATIVVLVVVGFLSGQKAWDRFAAFLWAFAFWDIFYYVFLFLFIGWPPTLNAGDVLFLIPMPWFGQVWFPLLVSFLTIGAIGAVKGFFGRSKV